jgi:hypothetical protein
MTELILKNKIDDQKLSSIIEFLKTWNVEAEIKTTSGKRRNRTYRNVTFTDFGITMPNGYTFNREEANAR